MKRLTNMLAVYAVLFFGIAACSGGGGGGVGGGTRSFTIGGTVSGLGASSTTVRLTTPAGANGLVVYANGTYTFPGAFANGTTYTVDMQQQPTGQFCTVANPSGTISGANVTNVDVNCAATYTIGGTVTGLSGSGLVLQNNGGDNLSVSANGTFTFAAGLPGGAGYAVTVSTQPSGPAQTCHVLRNGSGTMTSTNVTDVVVDCRAPRFAYVTNFTDNTISGYVMDPVSGRLRHNGYVLSPDTGARAVGVDPAGKFAYVVSFYSYTIRAYSINATTGALTFVNSLSTGANPIAVTVDPSGKFVYVANGNGTTDGVSAYSINSGTGALTSVGSYQAGTGPISVTVNPTGQYLYVANQNPSGTGSVSVFSINTSTGALTAVDADGVTAGTQATIAASQWPQTVTLDPSGRFAYVPNFGTADVSVYGVSAVDGSLTPVGSAVSTGGSGAVALAIDASGRYAYAANQFSDSVSVFSINTSTGALTAVDADGVTAGTQATIAAGSQPLAVSIDMTGRYVYTTNYGDGTVSVYAINASNGALTPGRKMAARNAPIAMAMANGATAVSYSPAYVYTANYNGGTAGNVSGFSVGNGSGALTGVSGSPFASGALTMGIATDPAGARAYIANAGSTITGFSIGGGGTLGALSGSPYAAPASQSAYAIAVDSSGRFAYTANYNNAGTGGVSEFSIDSGTGALTSLGAATAGLGSYAIATDPAGRFVYVANYTGVSVSGYTINASTGALTQIDADPVTAGVQDFAAGGAGSYPSGIAVDPTGRFVYIANDNTSITAYSINALTGMLTHIDADPGTAGVQDVSSTRAFAIAIEPTGRWAYVTHSGGFDTVDVYSIDATTGVLTATGSYQATGSNPWSATVDASGRFLYVANYYGNTVSVYSIDSATGAITPVTNSPFATGSYPRGIAATATMQ
jgi:6-phosphogluconolactonase (cycloisomerase 2 family)